jgi:hypothetical protein
MKGGKHKATGANSFSQKKCDKVDHFFIMVVVQAKVFGPQWCSWITHILRLSTS